MTKVRVAERLNMNSYLIATWPQKATEMDLMVLVQLWPVAVEIRVTYLGFPTQGLCDRFLFVLLDFKDKVKFL